MAPGYELVERLGEGGMGEVFLARQLSLDRDVAMKWVRREVLAEEWFLERLEREARLLARLRHPHLVTVHDFLRLPDGNAAVVMELVEGGSLRDRLRDAPNGLPIEESLSWIRQVASALKAAHAEGVIHRDIKPENILLDAAGQVRVTDFGMALSLASGSPRLTRTGATVGTPGYLAPEQLSGAATDMRTDLFALGVLLYEMLTGRLPVGSFEAPRRLRSEIPASAEISILQSLKPDPAARPRDVNEFVRLLDGGSPTGKTETPADASSPLSRRGFAIAGLTAGLAGGVTWYFLRPSATQTPGSELLMGLWQTLPWPADLGTATISGAWHREGDAVVSSDRICILGFPEAVPPKCDLRLTVRRLGGSQSVAVFFRHPAGFGSAELDGWSRHRSGVQAINGRTAEGPGGFDFHLHPGRDVNWELELRPEEVRMRVGETSRHAYPLAGRTLKVVRPWGWNPSPEGPSLAIGSYESPVRFGPLQWRIPSGG